MITSNIIQRVFHICVCDSIGTCFVIDVDEKQYIITARHIVPDLTGTVSVLIYHDNQWKSVNVTLVGHCYTEVDITVLTTNVKLVHKNSVETSMRGIVYGQDVYFLGFPYGMTGEMGKMNHDYPLPFVKKAIVSCLQVSEKEAKILFLDGHNNPGFSGGPVVFKEQGSNDFKIAGVISGYRFNEEPIYQQGQVVPLVYHYSTGIIISYGIKHAVDVIKLNPIGLQL